MWDLLIAFILIVSCAVTPMQISFYSNDDFSNWKIVDNVFDFLFLIDICFNFVSAYHDEEYVLVDDYKIIAYNYMKSWLTIDVIAIFPFWAF